ncbi:MAG: 2-isopropylmalate synthase [Candidatus Micrarchaeia archaeon]
MRAFVGEYNKEVRGSFKKMPKSVAIYDCTLRDGEQTPGVSFKKEEKLRIARQLDKLGVDYIEAGFPINTKPEFEAVKEIAGMGLSAKISGLARVIREDMDACIDAGVSMVHVFVSTSDIHLKYQIQKTRSEVYELAVNSVSYVKEHGLECLFSPMDATRTDFDYLVKVCKGVEEAGADAINIPDTVGVLNPPATRHLISRITERVKVPVHIHCHNDFGLAVANSLAAVEGGARGVHVTVNGMGERAGNASLEQVVMSLHALYGVKTNVKSKCLTETSVLVEQLSEVQLPPFYPIVGKNAFAHESGIHAHAVLKKAETFEPLVPEDVGQKRRIVIGKHSGKASIERALSDLGYRVEGETLLEITRRIKETAEAKKRIYDEDIIAIAEDVLGHGKREPFVVLDEVTVVTGNKVTPTASVVLKYEGETIKGASQGVGPVDAAANAIQAIIGADTKVKLMEYNLRAITGGTDALADVTIKIQDERRNVFQANAVDDDIVMASVDALLRAINEAISYRKRMKSKGETKR